MKKIVMLLMAVLCTVIGAQAQSIDPVTLLLEKVIRAIDRKVQAMQNQVMRLQNVQKQLENRLSLDRLTEIGETMQEEKELWKGYYVSLRQTKELLLQSPKLSGLLTLRTDLLTVLHKSKPVIGNDHRLTVKERNTYLTRLEALGSEVQGLTEKLVQVLRGGSLSASDAHRLTMLEDNEKQIKQKAEAIRSLVASAKAISLLRAKDESDALAVRKLYGLNQ